METPGIISILKAEETITADTETHARDFDGDSCYRGCHCYSCYDQCDCDYCDCYYCQACDCDDPTDPEE